MAFESCFADHRMSMILKLMPILLVLVASPGWSQEPLPLGESPPEETEPEAGLDLSFSRVAEDWGPLRYRGGLERGFFSLALAGERIPGAKGEAPRLALAMGGGDWGILLGGLGGRWGEGLLLGPRRRSALGSPASPTGPGLSGRPSTGREPLLHGASVRLRRGSWRGAFAWRLSQPGRAEPSLMQMTLAWRRLALDAQGGERGSGFAISCRGGEEGALWSLGAGQRWPAAGGVPRRGGLWRARLESTPVDLRAEALVLSGPRPAGVEGWLGAAEGWELHLALSGEQTGWRWRAARRLREGIGLGAGVTRREDGLRLARPCRAGGLSLDFRQIETQTPQPLSASPGFPRWETESALVQELGLAYRGPWRCQWRRRLGERGRGQLLLLDGPAPRLALMTWQLAVFESEATATPFMLFEAATLHRRVESLGGRGWRFGLRAKLGDKSRRLRLGLAHRHSDRDGDRLALWTELGGTLR